MRTINACLLSTRVLDLISCHHSVATSLRLVLFLGTLLLAAPRAKAACNLWTQTTAGPQARSDHAMAYDTARDVIVLFGGRNASGTYLGDTWEFDGISWMQRTFTGPTPSPRFRHALAYDTARHVVLLFGGESANQDWSDTWIYDGLEWQLVSNSGPSARNTHAMAFDSAHNEAVLFGGRTRTGMLNAQTWTWDGSVWTQKVVPGPTARFSPFAAFDRLRSELILFGGNNGTSDLSDTWAWNGAAWTQRLPSMQPSARRDTTMAFNPARANIVLFGGISGSAGKNDTWAWNGTTWSQMSVGLPPARWDSAMAYLESRGETILFSGVNSGGNINDAWGLTDCGLSGLVTDSFSGLPLMGVQVEVGAVGTATDASGAYFLGDAPTGFQRVTYSKNGYFTQSIWITILSGAVTTQTVALQPSVPDQPQPGQNIPQIQVTLDHLWQWDDNVGHFVAPLGGVVTIDPTKPTYLTTHGWDGTLDGIGVGVPCINPSFAASSIACAIRQAKQDANILAWDWKEQANPNGICDVPDYLTLAFFNAVSNPQGALLLVSGALSSTIHDARKSGEAAAVEGNKLGQALANQIASHGPLGSELHLIGHSHGGGVLGRAARKLKQLGYPVDSLTTLDTPKFACLESGCLVNTLKNVDPESVKPGGHVAVFYYSLAATGAGKQLTPAHLNLTNVALNGDFVPPLPMLGHSWIRGPNDGLPCPDDDGWFNRSVWDPSTSGPRAVSFNNNPLPSVLSVLDFPHGCYEEGPLFEFTPGCPEGRGGETGIESETPGLFLLSAETFGSAASWSGTDAALVTGVDPADENNRVILITEQAETSLFKVIAWPSKALEITFDYMFRDPIGSESLTVYVNDSIVYYDNANTSLATGQLHSSGAIAIDQFAGTTARLTFVLRGDGTPGCSVLLDNIRTWGFVSGDLSGDGKLDGLDVQPFVNAIIGNSSNPGQVYLADFDGDNVIGPEDVPQFVEALLSQ